MCQLSLFEEKSSRINELCFSQFCCQFRTASCHWLWHSKRNNIGCGNPQGCLLPLTGLIFSWVILTWKTGAWGWHILMAESFLMIIHLWWNVRKHSKPKISPWAYRAFGVPLGHNPSVVCNHLHCGEPQSMHQPSNSAAGVYITLPEIICMSDACVQNKWNPAGFRDGSQRQSWRLKTCGLQIYQVQGERAS